MKSRQVKDKKLNLYSGTLVLVTEFSDKRCDSACTSTSLALSLKYVLAVGRVVGILPVPTSTDEYNTNPFEEWIGRLGSIAGTIALGLSAVLTAGEFFYKRIGEQVMKAGPIAREARNLLFVLNGFFMFSYFLVRNSKFRAMFKAWDETNQNIKFPKTDLKFVRVIKLVSSCMLVSGFLGILLFTAKIIPWSPNHSQDVNGTFTSSVWEGVVWRFYQLRSQPVSFNLWRESFLLICSNLNFVVSNFTDLLIMLLARALWFRFRALTETVQSALADNEFAIRKRSNRKQFWAEIRSDHLHLCSLVAEFETFLSPIIFASFSQNLYSLCLQVHEAMLPSNTESGLDSVYSCWLTCHLLLRLSLVTYFGAGLNDAAHEVSLTMQDWSTQNYCSEMERLERYLGANPIGLTGLGCFLLSRQVLLVMFSISFTIEIVLLQATAADSIPVNS